MHQGRRIATLSAMDDKSLRTLEGGGENVDEVAALGVAVAGGLTDSDFQEGSYEDDAEEGSTSEEEEEEARGPEEDEINDAGLLRSMLRDSEEYYANLAAQEAKEEKHCWVCFASEEDDPRATWLHPCRSGTL